MLYLWVPGFIGLYFAKKEGYSLPFFKPLLKAWPTVWVFPLILLALTMAFCLPYCEMRSIDSFRLLLPTFLQRMPPWQMLSTFTLLWITLGFVLSMSLHLVGYMGQEIMFRGYALEKVKHLGFWKASWISGALWGIWEAPLVLLVVKSSSDHLLEMVWKVLFCLLLSPIMMYIRLNSKTIAGPAIFYGSLLHCYNILPYVFNAENRLYFGGHGLTGFLALLFLNVFLLLKTSKTPFVEYEL